MICNDLLKPSSTEKRKLRQHRIKLGSIHLLSLREIQEMLDVSKIRAMELSALSEFQSLPSVGIRFAEDLIGMGFYSLKDLKGKDGARLLDQYEKRVGVWTDPCVEDQFRLVVHYAHHPDVHKNWWDFTAERKAFREKNGYPGSRPKDAWHQREEFRSAAYVDAAKDKTKKDLAERLKNSVSYMKKNYGEKLSLNDLARASAVSSHHFLRQFKEVYEVTPIQYLTHIRIKKATSLLKSTNLPVSSISQQCGFENESAFIRLFKSHSSTTPLTFRKSYQQKLSQE